MFVVVSGFALALTCYADFSVAQWLGTEADLSRAHDLYYAAIAEGAPIGAVIRAIILFPLIMNSTEQALAQRQLMSDSLDLLLAPGYEFRYVPRRMRLYAIGIDFIACGFTQHRGSVQRY